MQIVKPKRVSEVLVDKLVELISAGQWPVGTRIPPEPELVTMFGVGRNTIREAVRALEFSGLLECRRGDGTYVRANNEFAACIDRVPTADILHLVEVRMALEVQAARSAAIRRTEEDLTTIRNALEASRRAYNSHGISGYVEHDVQFHIAIVKAAKNPLLEQIYDGIVDTIRRHLHQIVAEDFLSDTGYGPGHRELCQAIADHDPDAAEQALIHQERRTRAIYDRKHQ